jgi:hypothetical protein
VPHPTPFSLKEAYDMKCRLYCKLGLSCPCLTLCPWSVHSEDETINVNINPLIQQCNIHCPCLSFVFCMRVGRGMGWGREGMLRVVSCDAATWYYWYAITDHAAQLQISDFRFEVHTYTTQVNGLKAPSILLLLPA